MHKPTQFKDLGLSFSQKVCFSDFNEQILYGSRIAIIGRNGIGKSTLLKMIQRSWRNYDGNILIPDDVKLGYLPQIIDTFETESGGGRLNRSLTEALCQNPNLLLLDEPTNHLDKTNRRSLMNHLRHYKGTLIMVTHDVEALRCLVDTIWHIQQGAIHVFHGSYNDYQRERTHQQAHIEEELISISNQKKSLHHDLMREQGRNKRMRVRGEKSIEQRKWPTIRSKTKLGSGIKTGVSRLHHIHDKKEQLIQQRNSLYQEEIITAQFQLDASPHQKALISIYNASIGYDANCPVLNNIDFHLHGASRIALCGNNGSGKSTFVKALCNHGEIQKTGDWTLPNYKHIGYLDQHYQTLDSNQTVFETVASHMPHATYHDVRKHLNTFLFRKNEEVETKIAYLSGGEKARLTLCCIAAHPPALLILDEMTNNLDLETRSHVIQILNAYKGALMVISHDDDFLKAINIDTFYCFQNGAIESMPSFMEI